MIEAAKSSSQDQNLQRTVEQITNDNMNKAISQVMEKNLEAREVLKMTPQKRISNGATLTLFRRNADVVKTSS